MKNNKTTIGIIGFGRFGTLAASVLKQYGEVSVFDTVKQTAKARRIGVKFADLKSAAGADIVVLAVPISQTEKTVKKIAPLVKPGALVVDTCSVKALPCQWLMRHLPASVGILGTHPMFGPVTTGFDERKQTWDLKGLQIVLCPLRVRPAVLKKVKACLRSLELEIITVSPDEHDIETADTLAFMHFLGRSLFEAGFRERTIFPPGYKDLLRVYRTTTGDSWELMYDMNIYNPYARAARERFSGQCAKIETKISSNKKNGKKGLEGFRADIDSIDKQIMRLLAKRFQIVGKIGKIKRKEVTAIVNKTREQELIKRNSRNSGLNKKFVASLYRLIFKEAYKRQK